ncbi:HNH endonuclease [candidate division KSB1 bacterium]|nr:HNH endonuclease [candidate division KSB1 bacterium]
MKQSLLIKNLLAAGLDSSLAEKAIEKDFNLSTLRNATKKSLKQHFEDWEIQRIQDALQRKPVPDDIVEKLIECCDWSCCLCWDINRQVPIIIHHLVEHAKGGTNAYDNLVILCLNHHGLAHSKWEISRHPAPADYIKKRKSEFEKAIAEFKLGIRAAPGREGDTSTPRTQTDIDALKRIAGFLNRPAVFRPFSIEGNMSDFLAEMSNVILALNAGRLKTREGDELGDIKPISEFSNPQWRERMELVRDQFDTLRARVEVAIRQGELTIHNDGFYFFENRELPDEIDAMRRTIVSMLNVVLYQAGIPEIRGPKKENYRW